MVLLLLVCLVGSSVVLGYSTNDRQKHLVNRRTVGDLVGHVPEHISPDPPTMNLGDDHDHTHDGHKDVGNGNGNDGNVKGNGGNDKGYDGKGYGGNGKGYGANGKGYGGNGNGNGKGYGGNGKGYGGNGKGYDGNGNGKGYDDNGKGYDDNGKGYDGNGKGYDGNGKGYDGNGNGYDGKGHDDKGHEDKGHDGKAHDGKGHDGKGHDGKGHDGKGHDDKGHDDKGHDGKGHDGKGHDGKGHDGKGHDGKGHDDKGNDDKDHDDKDHDDKDHDGKGHDGKDHDDKDHDDKDHDDNGEGYGDYSDHDHDLDYDHHKSEEICIEFKFFVLKHMIGYPSLHGMSDQLNEHPAFMQIIMKGLSTFPFAYDTEMVTKQIIIDMTEEFLNLTKNCPSTIFTRLLLYAASKSFDSILLQDIKTFDEIVKLMRENGNVTLEQVRFYGRRMFGVIINEVAQNVTWRLFGEFYDNLKTVLGSIKNVLDHGETVSSIDLSGISVQCVNAENLLEMYRNVWSVLESRLAYDNFDEALDVLPLFGVPVRVRERVREKSKVLLRRGVQMMKSILSGLREERLGQLESEAQRLLSKTELEALNKVAEKLNWNDEPSNENENMTADDVVGIVVKKEMEDLYILHSLLKLVKNVSHNPASTVDPILFASLDILSRKLNDLIIRKCDTYKKYLDAYGPPIPIVCEPSNRVDIIG